MARGAWGGKVEFILTCIGYAVGLGNVWRFPYLTYANGGGAFLIPFVIMLFLIGIPLFFLELCFGQFASLGPIAIWRSSPLMKGLGFSMVFTNLMVALYYNVIISWCLYYLFASMTDVLPWETCDNVWNTPRCVLTEDFSQINGSSVIINGENYTKSELKSPSDEYYYRQVLKMTQPEDGGMNDSGTIVWQLAMCLLLCWMLVFFVLVKGISSLGKVVYFTSTFPYLLLTIMLIRGVTLEGAWTGIQFYLIPTWEKLADPKVWSDAATQIFYALSTCTGGLIAMASYNEFKNNTLRDSLIVPITNILTSFYAGFVIFSVLGYMSVKKGLKMEEVAAQGPGLVFVVYPEGISTMPVAPLWSILFFIMMMMLGLSSMFSMAETFFSGFMDEFPGLLRKTYYHTVAFRAIGCLCFYLISLPMITNSGFYVFTVWDQYTGGFPLLIIGLFELITLVYIYGYNNFADDIRMMLGNKPNIIFRILWSAITPLVIVLAIVFTGLNYKAPFIQFSPLELYVFPSWAEAIGWIIVTFCLIFIPAIFIYRMIADTRGKKFNMKLWKEISGPQPSWGPAHKSDWVGRYGPQLADNDGIIRDDNSSRSDIGEDNRGFDPDGKVDIDRENNNAFKTENELETKQDKD
jgi:solute carrier family 6 amino acid transporter-like protein 5/7/9/14